MIAAFDLDGTLLKKNGSFEFCRFLSENHFFSRLDLIFCAYTYMRHCYFGLSLLELHTQVFERLFRGKNVDLLRPYMQAFLEQKIEELWYVPALTRLRDLQKKGARCLILSSSPYFIVSPIAETIGVNEVFATEYAVDMQGNLSSLSLLMDGIQKGAILSSFHEKEKIAFSDSELDLPFLKMADIAVAVNPKSKLKKIAREEKWEIL